MSDKQKTGLALLFMGCTFTLPLLAGFTGWRTRDWQSGLWAGLAVFILFLVLTLFTLSRIHLPDIFTVIMPVGFSLVYLFLPDLAPGPVDDTIGMLFSSLLSLSLWLKRRRALKSLQHDGEKDPSEEALS